MRIPDAVLLTALRPHFGTHRCWHVARRLESAYELRRKFKGECARELYSLQQPDSGCDFLHFHRRMIRHFKWTIENTTGATYQYDPWKGPRVPSEIENLLKAIAFDVDSAYVTIRDLIAGDSVSQLGAFVEWRKPGDARPGAGIHNRIHDVINEWEKVNHPDPDAAMGDMGTAPANEFFWKLHGWIDEFYADWQRAHGEAVDQSPAPMHDAHVDCDPHEPSFPP